MERKNNSDHDPSYTGFAVILVTEGSSCKHGDALNKYLAGPEVCVLHIERLTSSSDSFCYAFSLLMQL